jgi:hypothetical protein
MRLKEVTVGRKFNLGNYESLELRLSAEPMLGEKANDVVLKLLAEINAMRNLR